MFALLNVQTKTVKIKLNIRNLGNAGTVHALKNWLFCKFTCKYRTLFFFNIFIGFSASMSL